MWQAHGHCLLLLWALTRGGACQADSQTCLDQDKVFLGQQMQLMALHCATYAMREAS